MRLLLSLAALLAALTSAHTGVAEGSERGIRLVAVGETAGKAIALPSGALRSSRLQIIGSGTGNFPPPPRMQALVGEILGHAAAGRLAIETAAVPLADVASAWNRSATGDKRLVLVP